MRRLSDLRIKLFADGANVADMIRLAQLPYIKGFTTNPTLMRKAGITDYQDFARTVLAVIPNHSISFEVFSDEFDEMERQAHWLASLGPHVYVKIPITNTRCESSEPLISRLTHTGIKVNVTAVMTPAQVEIAAYALYCGAPSYISVFAGRIADTGVDPVPMMVEALHRMHRCPAELIWASPREVLNIMEADRIGCHIITATSDILNKLQLLGRDLADYSLETVKMFRDDAVASGFSI